MMTYAKEKASITSTFNKKTAKGLIGTELEGSVEKVNCEPYEYVDKDSGEVILLDYRWVYLKPGDTVEQAVKAEQHQEELELV